MGKYKLSLVALTKMKNLIKKSEIASESALSKFKLIHILDNSINAVK